MLNGQNSTSRNFLLCGKVKFFTKSIPLSDAMLFIKNAKYLKDYQISIEFSSGEKGIADFKDIIQKYPAAAPLRDSEKFIAFYLDDWPTLAWNCDFDLSPNMIFELCTGKSPLWVQ